MKPLAVITGPFFIDDIFELYDLDINVRRDSSGVYSWDDPGNIILDITGMYDDADIDNDIPVRDFYQFQLDVNSMTTLEVRIYVRLIGLIYYKNENGNRIHAVYGIEKVEDEL